MEAWSVVADLGGKGTTPGKAGLQGEERSSKETWDTSTMEMDGTKQDWGTRCSVLSRVKGDSEQHVAGSQHTSL